MKHQTIEMLIERRPFKAFVLEMSSGESYEVVHPEMIFLAEDFAAVGMPHRTGDPPEVSDFAWLDLHHIVSIEARKEIPF